MDKEQAIEIIRSNYPPESYTMLREALNLSINLLEKGNKLEKFMKGRPIDRERNIVDATIEYIKEVERASMERYRKLS